jgi:hypothetical protein
MERTVRPIRGNFGSMVNRDEGLLFTCVCGALDMVHGLPSCGSGDLNTEREFPSDKVYRRDDRGVIGVESLIA